MSTTPPNRNPKRQRQKQGAQARRAAEMAALRRRQRNRRMVRFAVVAVVVVAVIVLWSALGGDDGDDVASTDETTTTLGEDTSTTAAPDVTPLACEEPSGENTDLETKPTVTVPAEPATELTCQDLVVGDGDEVTSAGDTVTVHYVGVGQASGKEFDASWDGDPATFPLTGVISGWTEGIPGMKVGGRRVLTIPGDRAYGEQGRLPDIAPNETLVFVIDLLSVTKLGG